MHFCVRLLGGVRAASILFQLHRLSCIISKISGGGNCVSSLAHLGVGLGQHIIQDERVVATFADKRWARGPGGQPQLSSVGRGGRGLRMWKTAMCRHIWNKTREPVIFDRMEGARGTSRCAVATKLCTPLMNALNWFEACRTSRGTAAFQELSRARCAPFRYI